MSLIANRPLNGNKNIRKGDREPKSRRREGKQSAEITPHGPPTAQLTRMTEASSRIQQNPRRFKYGKSLRKLKMGKKREQRKTVKFDSMARIPDEVQLYGPVEEKFNATANSNPRVISRIHPINLADSVGEGQGDYTSVNIIDPTMRIERSGKLDPTDDSESLFRIIVTFVLQASILNFDEPSVESMAHKY
jgi:hypothetical protein